MISWRQQRETYGFNPYPIGWVMRIIALSKGTGALACFQTQNVLIKKLLSHQAITTPSTLYCLYISEHNMSR